MREKNCCPDSILVNHQKNCLEVRTLISNPNHISQSFYNFICKKANYYRNIINQKYGGR